MTDDYNNNNNNNKNSTMTSTTPPTTRGRENSLWVKATDPVTYFLQLLQPYLSSFDSSTTTTIYVAIPPKNKRASNERIPPMDLIPNNSNSNNNNNNRIDEISEVVYGEEAMRMKHSTFYTDDGDDNGDEDEDDNTSSTRANQIQNNIAATANNIYATTKTTFNTITSTLKGAISHSKINNNNSSNTTHNSENNINNNNTTNSIIKRRNSTSNLPTTATTTNPTSLLSTSSAITTDCRDIIMEGYLQKRGANILTKYKTRWCKLFSNCVEYFGNKEEIEPLGTISLFSCITSYSSGSSQKNGFVIVTPTRTYFFIAATRDEQIAWVTTIEETTRLLIVTGLVRNNTTSTLPLSHSQNRYLQGNNNNNNTRNSYNNYDVDQPSKQQDSKNLMLEDIQIEKMLGEGQFSTVYQGNYQPISLFYSIISYPSL